MTGQRPKVYTIAQGLPFADALAAGVLAHTGGDPLAVARTLILLPTRRACRTVQEAFLRRSGGAALLLPRLQPIGDIDPDELLLSGEEPALADGLELPPAIPDLRRRLLLARLILKSAGPDDMTAGQAAWLAAELARLLDQVQTERLSFEGLSDLVPAEHAEHWGRTLDFLRIVTAHWPAILAEEGAVDPAVRRNALLEARAAAWRSDPPTHPVIAAGSTGSIPATADLLKTAALLPDGCVVLPGLDRSLEPAAWTALSDPGGGDQTHPQFGLARLLAHLNVSREEVADWATPPAGAPAGSPGARARLVSEALRPAATTDRWRVPALSPEEAGAAMADVSVVECPGPREEAGAIALVLREALERPRQTAFLVTPDRDLARRVAADLKRWGIAIDDSAGTPLESTPPGAYLRLLAAMAGARLAPVPLLAALKHPLAAGGAEPGAFRARVRRLERAVLRGPRPAPGFEGLRRALAALESSNRQRPDPADLLPWLDILEAGLEPFTALLGQPRAPLAGLMRAHVRVAEALAATDAMHGAERLWAGEAGEAAASFVDEALQAAEDFPEIRPSAYAETFDALLAGRVVRPRYGRHPRLQILGLLEARLQHADLVVLGGLNETVWPPEPAADPWMSRPMRVRFGLPLPERRIGLTAHDFSQAVCARRVVLTRSRRREGAPTVPSRWLLRLGTLLDGMTAANPEPMANVVWRDESPVRLFSRLNTVDEVEPASRPMPRPPLAARPRRLSVTAIETWMRDPYALYAKAVLGLRRLDPIDADPGLAYQGEFVHRALDLFVSAHPRGDLPTDALARLLDCGRAAFEPALARPAVWAFWWPRFQAVATWFVEQERQRRAGLAECFAEVSGEIVVPAPGGAFVLTAKADRIDRCRDGALAIIDYKTGALPSRKEVDAGFAPQLPLEAAIAKAGGFGAVGPADRVAELAFWRLTGGRRPGDIRTAGKDPGELAEEALAGLEGLIRAFDDPGTPYAAQPRPGVALRFNDYAHLARIQEWAVVDTEAET